MLVTKILEHFDAYELLHVDVNDVRDQLVDMGVQDEIRTQRLRLRDRVVFKRTARARIA